MPKPPPPPEPALHAAARTGNIAELERLLREGHDVNSRAHLEVDNGQHLRGLTPLMVAARSIDGAGVETLRWLLAHGADLHARSAGGNTAAWYAAGKGGRWEFHPWRQMPDHVDRLRLLLDAGLDAREVDDVGRSLLSEACAAGDPARVRLVLERGADPNRDPNGPPRELGAMELEVRSMMAECDAGQGAGAAVNPENARVSFTIPLFLAAASGSVACIEALVAAGVDLTERDEWGETALMHAGSPEVAEMLIDLGADPRARTPRGDDTLHVVLHRGDCGGGACGPARYEVARVLLRRGARLEEAGTRFENTRLYDAAFKHDLEGVAFLLAQGCAADERDEHGRSAVHAICWQGEYTDEDTNRRCEQIIRMLVEAGADVNAADDGGDAPLHEAAFGDWGNQTAVRTLLELGAAADPVNAAGQTPLMLAADRGEVECIRLLLSAGADPTRTAHDGGSARTAAAEHLATWRQLAAEPPEPVLPYESPQEAAARTASALREAEEAYRLVHEASPRR